MGLYLNSNNYPKGQINGVKYKKSAPQAHERPDANVVVAYNATTQVLTVTPTVAANILEKLRVCVQDATGKSKVIPIDVATPAAVTSNLSSFGLLKTEKWKVFVDGDKLPSNGVSYASISGADYFDGNANFSHTFEF